MGRRTLGRTVGGAVWWGAIHGLRGTKGRVGRCWFRLPHLRAIVRHRRVHSIGGAGPSPHVRQFLLQRRHRPHQRRDGLVGPGRLAGRAPRVDPARPASSLPGVVRVVRVRFVLVAVGLRRPRLVPATLSRPPDPRVSRGRLTARLAVRGYGPHQRGYLRLEWAGSREQHPGILMGDVGRVMLGKTRAVRPIGHGPRRSRETKRGMRLGLGRGVAGDELVVMGGRDPQVAPVAGRRGGRGARCWNGVHGGQYRGRGDPALTDDWAPVTLRRGSDRAGRYVRGLRGPVLIPARRRGNRLRPPHFEFFARLEVGVSGDPGLPPPLGHQAPAVPQHHVVNGGGKQRVGQRLHAGRPGASG